MAERVLIAGCGDLGLRVAQRLLARGDTVYGLRRRPASDLPKGLHWIQGDLTLPVSLSKLPTELTQLVYAPTPGERSPAAYRAIFVDGLAHLLASLDTTTLKRVVFVSSSAVYGEHGDAWVDETTPPAPPGFNGELLLEAERWLAAQACPSTRIRLAGLYGPGRMQMIERLRAGALQAPRATPHWANRIHVDDAASAIAHVLSLADPKSLYVGVDNTPLPLHVLYDHLATLVSAPPVTDGPGPVGVGSKRLSNARLRASGWQPQWPDARLGYADLLSP